MDPWIRSHPLYHLSYQPLTGQGKYLVFPYNSHHGSQRLIANNRQYLLVINPPSLSQQIHEDDGQHVPAFDAKYLNKYFIFVLNALLVNINFPFQIH